MKLRHGHGAGSPAAANDDIGVAGEQARRHVHFACDTHHAADSRHVPHLIGGKLTRCVGQDRVPAVPGELVVKYVVKGSCGADMQPVIIQTDIVQTQPLDVNHGIGLVEQLFPVAHKKRAAGNGHGAITVFIQQRVGMIKLGGTVILHQIFLFICSNSSSITSERLIFSSARASRNSCNLVKLNSALIISSLSPACAYTWEKRG